MTVPQHRAALLTAYAIVVLAVDCLATRGVGVPFDWTIFAWRHESGFDLFKFIAWLAVPVALTRPWRDLGWFGFNRWKRRDLALLAGLFLLGAFAVAAVAWIPSLREMYPSLGEHSSAVRWQFVITTLVWLSSWLIGWEFLHRFVLARALADAFPRRPVLAACAIIPVIEALYHLAQGKGALESAGVLVFGILLTSYAVHRRNVLLPFLAHLFIELALVAFLVLV